MILKLLLSMAVIAITFSLNAQEHVHSEKCGHSVIMQAMENQYPGYKDLVNRTFQDAKERGVSGSREVYTIKTVVHVVWKENEENISDERIFEQIAALNEDYRYTNPDKANLRPEFADIAGDAEIEFELVSIQRVQTTETFGIDIFTGSFDDDKLKDSANGGSSAFDNDQYLNIWVTNVQPIAFGGIVLGQILGYAFPPADIFNYPDLNNWPAGTSAPMASYDGVVIHYPAFGGRNRVVNDPNLGGNVNFEGRTATHEVGHYLGLRHYWGDPVVNPLDPNDPTNEDGCDVDDGIDDTPNAQSNSQQSGCDANKNTCIDAMDDLPDMWENYMDYSDEKCQVTFTNGQIALVRGVIEGPRVDLLNPTPVAADLTISPSDPIRICSGVEVSFSSSAPTMPESWLWHFDGGTPSLSAQENPAITYHTPGTYDVTLYIPEGNGVAASTVSGVVIVEETPEFTVEISNTACDNSNNTGAIDLVVSSGNLNSISWSNNETTEDISNLAAGDYTVTISYAVNATTDCELVRTYTVVNSAISLSPTASATDLDLATSGNVSFTSTSTGATAWSWDFGDGNTSSMENPSHTYTDVGVYEVSVTATNDECTEVMTLTITVVDTSISVEDITGLTNLSISPNPFQNQLSVQIATDIQKELNIKVFDAVGRIVVDNKQVRISGSNQLDFNTSIWNSGVYFLQINDGKNQGTVKLLKL